MKDYHFIFDNYLLNHRVHVENTDKAASTNKNILSSHDFSELHLNELLEYNEISKDHLLDDIIVTHNAVDGDSDLEKKYGFLIYK
jgi:hypothetical protein